jgi:hypothetical protein
MHGNAMPVYWKVWKSDEAVFPSLPQTLEIDIADFHISTSPAATTMRRLKTYLKKFLALEVIELHEQT